METETKAAHTELGRLEHPFILVFLLGGVLGAGINVAVSCLAHFWNGWHPLLSIFLGTLANQFFHYLYYSVVFLQRKAPWRIGAVPQFVVFAVVAAISAGLLWLILQCGLSFVPAVVSVVVLLSLANALLVRIVSFSSAELAEIEYRAMTDSYYDDHTDAKKVGWFRAWFHRSRFERLTRFVTENFRPGMRIADLGCGNCWWNTNSLPVTGVDINENMLAWAQRHQRVQDYQICTDLARTGLPEGEFDIVVMSETLEHLLDLRAVLAEVRRILKPHGSFLITVPYDFVLSPFFLLFNLHCVFEGFVRGSRYHKYRCGHINHFTKSRLRRLLGANGFTVKRVFIVNGMTIYAAAEKTENEQPSDTRTN